MSSEEIKQSEKQEITEKTENPEKTEKSKKPKKIKRLKKVKSVVLRENKIEKNDLENEFQKIKNFSADNKKYNRLLLKKEQIEGQEQSLMRDSGLYPTLDDPNFILKIAEKREFNNTKYDGEIYPVESRGDELSKVPFELSSHQLFVRNFLSFQTPYNSLLLFHGLGSGKTCSSISICEEMRDYLNQLGISKRIMIIASPNVQENFRLQMFDERKLEKVQGLWNIRGCTGNKFLKEINPMSMKGLTRTRVIKQINRIITQSYLFLGYTEFANYIDRVMSKYDNIKDDELREKKRIRSIKNEFANRLIVIDEVQNIRIANDKVTKRISSNLMIIAELVNNLKFLLLSATPMFNTHTEIVWLMNLMNVNDGRAKVEIKDIFTKTGRFRETEGNEIVGKELLLRKMRGYVSFVRGENPYTFPYRIFPSMVSSKNTFADQEYPKTQATLTDIKEPIKYLDVYVSNIGNYQEMGYNYIVERIQKKIPDSEQLEIGLGYTDLDPALQSLNMVYPLDKLTKRDETKDSININIRHLIGNGGLKRCMKYTVSSKKNFAYKPEILKKYGPIFAPENIGKYSSKISQICESIKQSRGIVLVYSQFIDGGCIPIALALEEMGFKRFGSQSSFFKSKETKLKKGKTEKTQKYAMITGDPAISPNNLDEIKALTNDDNRYGDKIKVVIISKAAAEGIDLKNIRQVHILEPWYNMMRIEQIIGRAVRNFSHILLPFVERNVQIFLHGTILSDKAIEALDLYVYRFAEGKAIDIGKVSRLLKENSVDCMLNSSQNNFTKENMKQDVDITVSSGENISYSVGDKPFTSACDYMESCEYKCNIPEGSGEISVKDDTYNEQFIVMYLDKIHQRIRDAFQNNYVYRKDDLLLEINKIKTYPLSQINYALDQFINDKNLYLKDIMGRDGSLINIGEFYMFQPNELNNTNLSYEERRHPIDFKRTKISIKLPDNVSETIGDVKDKKSPDKVIDDKDKKDDKPVKSELKSKTKSKKQDKYNKENDNDNALGILELMKTQYNLVVTPTVPPTTDKDPLKGNKDWYASAGRTTQRLLDMGFSIENIKKYAIAHIVESLSHKNKLSLLNFIYQKNTLDKESENLSEVLTLSQEYFKFHEIENDGDIYMLLLTDNNVATVFIFELDNQNFIRALPSQIKNISDHLIRRNIKREDVNDIIGFMTLFKGDFNIFKTKNMTGKRNSGMRCDQSGKAGALKIISAILNDPSVTSDDERKKLNVIQLCSEQEFILRHYDEMKKDGKRWFLAPEEYALSKEINSAKLKK
tara:strand:- start:8675 stop:12505 length:3831 start_codon:yes stop_codon:yes gene_type:complete